MPQTVPILPQPPPMLPPQQLPLGDNEYSSVEDAAAVPLQQLPARPAASRAAEDQGSLQPPSQHAAATSPRTTDAARRPKAAPRATGRTLCARCAAAAAAAAVCPSSSVHWQGSGGAAGTSRNTAAAAAGTAAGHAVTGRQEAAHTDGLLPAPMQCHEPQAQPAKASSQQTADVLPVAAVPQLPQASVLDLPLGEEIREVKVRGSLWTAHVQHTALHIWPSTTKPVAHMAPAYSAHTARQAARFKPEMADSKLCAHLCNMHARRRSWDRRIQAGDCAGSRYFRWRQQPMRCPGPDQGPQEQAEAAAQAAMPPRARLAAPRGLRYTVW